jgi:hypothetical protein
LVTANDRTGDTAKHCANGRASARANTWKD